MKTKHEPCFVVKLPRHSMNVYTVTDCDCGWQSPLCATKKARTGAVPRAPRLDLTLSSP